MSEEIEFFIDECSDGCNCLFGTILICPDCGTETLVKVEEPDYDSIKTDTPRWKKYGKQGEPMRFTCKDCNKHFSNFRVSQIPWRHPEDCQIGC